MFEWVAGQKSTVIIKEKKITKDKSEINLNESYENLRYEGFGPYNVAFVIETLTNNKNRTASSIRTILQKNGGRLGENGSTTHFFFHVELCMSQKNHFQMKKF